MPSITTTFENGDQVQLTGNTAIWGTITRQVVDGSSGARSISCQVAIKDSEGRVDQQWFNQALLSAKA